MKLLFAVGFGFIFGCLIMFLWQHYIEEKSPDTSLRLNNSAYKFINPLLDAGESPVALLPSTISDLRNRIEESIGALQHKGIVTEASVYYRDLKNGPTFSINEESVYTPASLLKLTILMSYYRETQTRPGLLEDVITYDTPIETPWFRQQDSGALLEVGKSYTVNELIESMIVNSNNYATILLERHLDREIREKLFEDFSIPKPPIVNETDAFMGVKQYSSLFRILYNGTYLTDILSERALEILSRSTYQNGLRAGVPKNITVASKFGTNEHSSIQLHDCGIVYHPQRPYILCIMTKGSNYASQEKLIADISSLVYNTVEQTPN